MKLGRHEVGFRHPTYFIADVASNHDGDLARALKLIGLAAAAGAQAVKFQHFKAETIVSDYGFKQFHRSSHQSSWKKSVFETYKENETPLEWTETLAKEAALMGLDFMTAPYDLSYVEQLNPYVCAWKLGSGDINWDPMLAAMGATGKPIIIATGASNGMECVSALTHAKKYTQDVALLQCNTNYTGSEHNFKHINLYTIVKMLQLGCESGLSDHTPGYATALGAVALGGRIIEKHLTDDNDRDGPDHGFSLDGWMFKAMVEETRRLEAALGDGFKRVELNELETVILQRRSIRAVRDIKQGEPLTEDMLICLRPCPGDAMAPFMLRSVLGQVASRDIKAGDYLRDGDAAPIN